jgi:tellurite resistance protein
MLQKVLIVACFLIYGSAFSQEALRGAAPESVSNRRLDADKIFNDLQQALPVELKSTLDSMRATTRVHKNPADSFVTQKERQPSETLLKASPELKSLSRDMQARVEKTMAEIEKQHQQRTILFKEKLKTRQ